MTVDKREKNKTYARSNKGGKTPTSRDDEGAVLRKVNSSRKTKSARERTRDKRDGPKLSAVNNNPSDEDGAVLRKVNSSRKTKSGRERTRDKRDGPKLSAVNNNPSDEGGAVLRKVNKNGKKTSRKDADKAE